MKNQLNLSDPFWWLWAVTLIFIISAVAGWGIGYWLVIAISALQVLVFLWREKSLLAFPSQIRLAYFALTLTGLWIGVRLPVYIFLLLGTIMVVFFGRCSISLVLKKMPWNRERVARLN